MQGSDRNEEDWFADIMNDDIIKLDESSLTANPHLLPTAPGEPQPKITSTEPSRVIAPAALPFQGTANRRLRLRRPKIELKNATPLTAYESGVVTLTRELVHSQDSQKSQKNLGMAIKHRVVLVLFVIILVLLLYMKL